jgi:hypothetical protein
MKKTKLKIASNLINLSSGSDHTDRQKILKKQESFSFEIRKEEKIEFDHKVFWSDLRSNLGKIGRRERVKSASGRIHELNLI